MSSLLRRTTTALLTMALACALACGDDGGDDGTIDAAVSFDASNVDAEGPDANQATACNTLCTCATTYCSATMNECLAECAGLPASVTACRITHCGYAQQSAGGAATHCPHVDGDSTDNTTPAECIFDNPADAGP